MAFGYEVCGRAADALVHCSWHVAASVGGLAGREHIWGVGQAGVDHGLLHAFGDRGQVVGFGVEGAGGAVCGFCVGVPFFWVEGFGLCSCVNIFMFTK